MAAVLNTPAKLPEPTREQRQLAYAHMARPGWPPTLDAALAVQAYRVAIDGLARRLNRPRFELRTGPGHTLPRLPAPPTPTEPPAVVKGRAAAKVQAQVERAFTGLPDPLGAFPRTVKGPGWMGHAPTSNTNVIDRKRLAANDRDD